MSEETNYTVHRNQYGIWVIGSFPLDEMTRLIEANPEYDILAPSISTKLGASIALTTRERLKLWEKKLAPEPISEDASIEERISHWVQDLDRGVSSDTIWKILSGRSLPNLSYFHEGVPHDSDDLSRCVRLLDRIPEWRERLSEVAEKYPEWEPLVDNWGALEERYRAGTGFSIQEGQVVEWVEEAVAPAVLVDFMLDERGG